MIRILVFFAVLAAIAFGLDWLADRPGDIVLTWQGYRIETSLLVGLGVVLLTAIAIAILWTILRFIFRIPSLMALARKARRRNKGYAALSRGILAAGAGDVRQARKSANEANRHLPEEPLSLLLRAQAAQLSQDRAAAEAAFNEMMTRPETRLLGLRGLHIEARRRGDHEAAHHYASQAHRIAPLPWAGTAVLEHHATSANWEDALATVETNLKAHAIDAQTAERQRAVLETAIALERQATDPVGALALARRAIKRRPDLVPAVALASRLLARRGEIRKASAIVERAWQYMPHPDLAAAYLDVRPGDSSVDRLDRARRLFRLKQDSAEGRIALARAALNARDFKTAREAMAPLVAPGERPTSRMCRLMAEIEEAQHGDSGAVREWLARASRAPSDAAWIADGIISSQWAPISPVSGKLDAFEWRQPDERLDYIEAMPEMPEAIETEQAPPALTAPEPLGANSHDEDAIPPRETKGDASSSEESLLGEAANTATEAAASGRSRLSSGSRPVMFPQPVPPDDPGTEPEKVRRVV
ncbi:MAG: heme biosynthesis protein HemY [Methylobacteriaceae bacterium]|nr:heme biosynthesis protein HemY [Methylobacteriaceae bacterium]MBV9395879.1 heme biosynthesis protein HemY [Methylobacteriaceae bacterium]